MWVRRQVLAASCVRRQEYTALACVLALSEAVSLLALWEAVTRQHAVDSQHAVISQHLVLRLKQLRELSLAHLKHVHLVLSSDEHELVGEGGRSIILVVGATGLSLWGMSLWGMSLWGMSLWAEAHGCHTSCQRRHTYRQRWLSMVARRKLLALLLALGLLALGAQASGGERKTPNSHLTP